MIAASLFVVSSVAVALLLADLRFWGRIEEHDDRRRPN